MYVIGSSSLYIWCDSLVEYFVIDYFTSIETMRVVKL